MNQSTLSVTARPYRPTDTMRSLIIDNNLLLMVMSRFGLPLGFGDKRVEDLCRENDVDCPTFLAVCNFISGRDFSGYVVDLHSLMGYLRRAHSYFLEFLLPTIRRKLIESINCSDSSDVPFLLMRMYDDYVGEVERHMGHENTTIFEYVEALRAGRLTPGFSIREYEEGHTGIVEKLNDLKDIFIYHYNQKDNDLLNSALFDIINCEHDLISHCQVEDTLFVPAVKRLEQKVASEPTVAEPSVVASTEVADADPATLSDREKDIIRCVARGLSNKEIADDLKLSFHTVTTYRRNITAKLGIHSAAGLTIFAIIHHLIDIDGVSLSSPS